MHLELPGFSCYRVKLCNVSDGPFFKDDTFYRITFVMSRTAGVITGHVMNISSSPLIHCFRITFVMSRTVRGVRVMSHTFPVIPVTFDVKGLVKVRLIKCDDKELELIVISVICGKSK